MTDTTKVEALDSIDRLILVQLQADGRTSNADLARNAGLSAPATHARIRRLEEQGYIQGYVARLDREALGYDMLCFINVVLQMHQPEAVQNFREAVQAMPEVLECHHITGDFDYLLKVVIRNRQDLERFLIEQLTPVPGIARIQTSLALTEIKNSTQIPID